MVKPGVISGDVRAYLAGLIVSRLVADTGESVPIHSSVTHEHLLRIMVSRPTDYKEYGGEVVRWEDEDADYPDCSCGCKWAAWLSGELGFDWCVCTNPGSPRVGLLTFEHQAGKDCFESDETSTIDE
jgi:hypothetical protein